MPLLITLLALLPFVLLLVLVVVRKWPVLKAMPLVWFVCVVLAFFVWQVESVLIVATFVKGTFIAIEIMLIIFGALFVLGVLKEKHQLAKINSLLCSIFPDVRVQAILIAWLFSSLIEGVSGFGVPAAVAAPLLVSLGFAPFLAVVISLIGNSTTVSFGAAGLPVTLGIGSLGFDPELLVGVTRMTALLHSSASLIVPLTITYFVLSFVRKKEGIVKDFIATIPFAIMAWVFFTIPYFLAARFIGPELPSILGGGIGLLLTALAAKYGFLVPKKVISFGDKRGREVSGSGMLKAVSPYLLIVGLLLLTRVIVVVREKLSGMALSMDSFFGTGISYSFLPLYTPSFFFILAGIVSLFLFRAKRNECGKILFGAFDKIKFPLVALIFTLALVQLLINSGINLSGLGSIPIVLANSLGVLSRSAYVFVAPVIGLFGSFIAGSNTVSNLLFGVLQAGAGSSLGISLGLVLALQVVGGAVGNMVAIHNVIAASSSVGLEGQVGRIIRKTIWISLIYALIVGFVGFFGIT
mmetsp:Transcript_606/g.435  ORF Transcript_606/g.435 Transcript_606/m.435 type:complete len:524 (-) Transcript_606:161-1732(-)